MNRIIVTGGAGFIGFHLADYLSNNDKNEVTIIDNFTRNKEDKDFQKLLSKNNVRFILADMTNSDFYSHLTGFYDSIYHLAAINGTKYFYEKPYEVLRVNILSLMNLIEWINPSNCGKFVFTSSSEAYAGTINKASDIQDYMPTKEDIPLSVDNVFNARFSYGGSKITGELLTINYFRKVDVPYSIIRYHNIYGPRMGYEHVIPEFLVRCYKDENPFNIMGGEETRAFCYISDAVTATELVMENQNCSNEILHVGNSNEEIKIIDLAQKVLHYLKLDTPINIKPAPKGCVMRRCPNIEKLKNLTGYSPKVPLNKGIELSHLWYKEHTSVGV